MEDLKAQLKEAEARLNGNAADRAALFGVKDRIDNEIADLKKQIAVSEVTYSIGDRFKNDDGRKWLIVVCAGQVGTCVSLSALDGGCLYNGYQKVEEYKAITQWEFQRFASSRLTRYWDNHKQCKC